MSLFGDLFGDSNVQSSNQNVTASGGSTAIAHGQQQQTGSSSSTNNQSTNTSNNSTTNQSGSTTQTQQGQTTTSTLDPAVQAMLVQLLPQLATGVTGGANPTADNTGALQQIAAMLTQRASSSNNVDQQVQAAQAVAKQNYDLGTNANIQQVKQQIGSTGNTFSQLLQQQGDVSLNTNLAKIDADTRAAARTQDTNDFAAAIQALTNATSGQLAGGNQPLAQLLSVVQALTGANTTTSSSTSANTIQNLLNTISGASSSNTTDIATQLQDLLTNASQQTNQEQSAQTQTNASSKKTGGLIGGLLSLF